MLPPEPGIMLPPEPGIMLHRAGHHAPPARASCFHPSRASCFQLCRASCCRTWHHAPPLASYAIPAGIMLPVPGPGQGPLSERGMVRGMLRHPASYFQPNVETSLSEPEYLDPLNEGLNYSGLLWGRLSRTDWRHRIEASGNTPVPRGEITAVRTATKRIGSGRCVQVG